MKINLILNEMTSVYHNEIEYKSCSGTLVSALRLAVVLSQHCEVNIYHFGEDKIIDDIEYKNIKKLEEEINNKEVYIFVGKAIDCITLEFLKPFVIYWSHNYENYNNKKGLIKNNIINKIVCVSLYQMFTLIKQKLFFKATTIYNIFNLNRPVKLIFVGSLTKEKGFHNLCEIYHQLKDDGVSVQLEVFGSSNIYRNDSYSFGISGVVDKDYEKTFIKYISEDGVIDSDVRFYGSCSREKINEVAINCDFFVSGLNENGAAECFSISFLEMQNIGIPVLTLNRGGQKESLYLSGSRSFTSKSDIKNYISNFYFKRFFTNDELISSEWLSLIENKNTYNNKRKYLLSIIRGVNVTINNLVRYAKKSI